MPFQRTNAVCLRGIDFSETSQVLRFFTPAQGKISCIAKGARRRKGAFRAPFETLSEYDLVRIEKRPGTLDILTQGERLRSFAGLRAEYPRFVAACYGADLTDALTADGMPVEGLYERLVELFERLEARLPVPDALFSFEARAFRALGLLPRARECGVCRKAIAGPEACFSVRDGGAECRSCRVPEGDRVPVRRASLESLARFSEGEMPKEAMKKPLVDELRRIFDLCVGYHAGRELRSARFVRDTI